MTELKLEEKDCCLVINDKEITIHVPDFNEDDILPDSVIIVLAIGTMLKDANKDLLNLIEKEIEKLQKETEDEG